MLNKIFVMGRLTHDPELRRTGSGTPVCSFSIACDRDFKSQSGEKETDFFDVVAWCATGEFVSKYFTKGRMAVVEGRLQIREWQDTSIKGGVKFSRLLLSIYRSTAYSSHTKLPFFPSLPWPSVSVICEFFKMTEWRKNAVKKKKNFSKSWPKRITSNGVFSKRERENPFPAAKEDDALKLPWNQKERVLHIFDSYCKKILRQENVDMQRSEVRHRVRECSFSELPSELLAKLCC